MSKFAKGKKKTLTAISTASLPDVIFMLLFFFMVTTVMREVDYLVLLSPPTADQVQKLEDKSLVNYIYIGKPINSAVFGTVSRIQLNDAFAEPEEIRDFIAFELSARFARRKSISYINSLIVSPPQSRLELTNGIALESCGLENSSAHLPFHDNKLALLSYESPELSR